MRAVVLTTMFTAGDVLPFLRLGSALRKRGNQVTLVTHAPYEEQANKRGLTFGTWDTPREYEALLADGLEFDTPAGFLEIYRRHVVPKLAAEIRALRAALDDDAILVTRSGPALAARCVAEQMRVPLVEIYPGPGHLTPPAIVAALVRQLLPEIDRVRAEVGLAPIADVGAWLGNAAGRIGTWPEWFAPREREWPSDLTLTGFLVDDELESEPLAAGVRDFLDAGEQPILIAGGTGKFFTRDIVARCVEACRKCGRRALVVTAFQDLVPSDASDLAWVPHVSFSSVLPRVVAVIHHGGIGTSFQALRASVPQLVLGAGGDRPTNGLRLAQLGVGAYLPKSRWEIDPIAQALETLASSHCVRQACTRAAESVTDARAITCESIESVSRDPRPASEIRKERVPSVSRGEHVAWNEGWVHEQIDRVCREHGSSIAVELEGEAWTYAELGARAMQLATWMKREAGVGPESRVAVAMDRSFELVQSLLAIWFAGGAYVPIDPDFPEERVKYMLQDSSCDLLLTSRQRLPWIKRIATSARVCAVDAGEWRNEPTSSVVQPVCGAGLAYVIYTSGSTGQPKGAMNTFGGIRNRLLWMQREYGLTSQDVVLQKTPFSFDVSVWEFFWPLLVGAKLVLARPEGHKDPRYIEDVMIKREVTTAHFVPSMLGLYLKSAREVGSLRRVICSGEALPDAHVHAFDRIQPRTELHNLYGPTEAAVDVSAIACKPGEKITIGRAVANTELSVLDNELRVVEEDVAGEIYISGIQVGRGYWGRPGLTAERFLPNPSGNGARVYRSGDVGRYGHGKIEYIGRTDAQVKVRGYRIELGEIESVLLSLHNVRDVAVVAREIAPNDVAVVAYVSLRSNEAAAVPLIRESLRQKLPLYLVPTTIVVVDSFPLTPSGKIDRKALPSPRSTSRARHSVRAPIERELADIWCDLLDLDDVSPDDDFFWLGGHSIMAAQMLARAGAMFDVDLGFDVLFSTEATISAIADHVAELRGVDSSTRQIFSVARDTDHPVSPLQEGILEWMALRPPTATMNLTFSPTLEGVLDVRAFARAVAEVVRRHETLRTRFVRGESTFLQHIDAAPKDPLVVIDLRNIDRQAARAEAERLLHDDRHRPFQLAQEHGARFTLVQETDSTSRCIVTIHQIACSAPDITRLWSEIAELYDAASATHPVSAPLIQNVDYAMWLRSWLDGPGIAIVERCRRRLEGVVPCGFRVDRPRGAQHSIEAETVAFVLPTELNDPFDALCRQQRISPAALITTAVCALIAEQSQSRDIVVGLVTGARNVRPELADTIGRFLNVVPCRLQIDPEAIGVELLGRARRALAHAYADRIVPGEMIVKHPSAMDSALLSVLINVVPDVPPTPCGLRDVTVTDTWFQPDECKSEIVISVTREKIGASIGWRWLVRAAKSHYDRATVERIASGLMHVVRSLVTSPERPLQHQQKVNGPALSSAPR